jgi:hypothetical protein
MQHLILGVFSDGNGAIQTFIIQSGIMIVTFSFLLTGNSPVRGVERS